MLPIVLVYKILAAVHKTCGRQSCYHGGYILIPIRNVYVVVIYFQKTAFYYQPQRIMTQSP